MSNVLKRDFQSTLIKRISRGGVALTDQAIVSGANFGTTIIVARALGPMEFGVFSLAWIVVLLVGGMQRALVGAPMMSIGPKEGENDKPSYFAVLLAQQAVFTVLCLCAIAGGSLLTSWLVPDWDVVRFAVPLAFAGATLQMQDFLRRYFYARLRSQIALAIDSVSYIGRLIALFALFVMGVLTIEAALWAIAAGSVVAALIAIFYLGDLSWQPQRFRSVLLRQWQFSRWLAASELSRFFSRNLFIIAAGSILGATSVGAIRAAQSLMGITNVMFQAIDNVVTVRCGVSFQRGGNAALVAQLQRVTVLGGGATVVAVSVCAAVPDWLLGTVFGADYSGYGDLIRWFGIIYLLMFLGTILRIGLRTVEYTRPIFLSLVYATVFSIVFAYPLTDSFGLTGVMAGLLAAQGIRQFVLWRAFRSKILAKSS